MLCTFMMLGTRCCCHPSIWLFPSRTSFPDTKKNSLFTRDIFLGPFEIIYCQSMTVTCCFLLMASSARLFETPPTPSHGPFPWPASKYNQSAVMWKMLSCFNSMVVMETFIYWSLANLEDNEYVGCLGDLFFQNGYEVLKYGKDEVFIVCSIVHNGDVW